MERLEKIVNKHHEEHIPLLIRSHYPIAEEEIIINDIEEDLKEETPKDEEPYNTVVKSVVLFSSLVWGVIGAVQLYKFL